MNGAGKRAFWLFVLGAATVPLHPEFGARAAGASPGPLRVRASEAFAPCLGPAIEAFSRETGIVTTLDVKEPDPPGDADVVIGDDAELTRILEGGVVDPSTSFDLGYIPWVLVVPEHSPAADVSALAATDSLYVLGGTVGRDARTTVKGVSPERLRISRNGDELRRARYALVPRSLAGPGEQRPAAVRPLIASASAIAKSTNPVAARRLLAFLDGGKGRAYLSSCFVDRDAAGVSTLPAKQAAPYAASVVDWWLPDCTLRTNAYNDPQLVVGPPDAQRSNADLYFGMMSLGQGGYVTVDMGGSAIDGSGADVRVFQTTSIEPVSLYAAQNPQGPFTLIALRRGCGERTPGLLSNHCDFDLREGGIAEARYFKIEDGEIFPCLAAGTPSEGADIDAIQILNPKP